MLQALVICVPMQRGAPGPHSSQAVPADAAFTRQPQVIRQIQQASCMHNHIIHSNAHPSLDQPLTKCRTGLS